MLGASCCPPPRAPSPAGKPWWGRTFPKVYALAVSGGTPRTSGSLQLTCYMPVKCLSTPIAGECSPRLVIRSSLRV